MTDDPHRKPDPRLNFAPLAAPDAASESSEHSPGVRTAQDLGILEEANDGKLPPAAADDLPYEPLSERRKRD
jgi:hypothetical protein